MESSGGFDPSAGEGRIRQALPPVSASGGQVTGPGEDDESGAGLVAEVPHARNPGGLGGW
jgi:hypothetical protein